jgi:Fic family protein
MRNYEYTNWENLITPDIVGLLTKIHEFKGRQDLFIKAKADALTQLIEIAKIQSTESSNKIEGIYTSNERLKKLVKDKSTPQTRDEEEIAGYRDVLNTIHENHEHIPVKPTFILQFHRDLYKFSGVSYGGNYKTSNNVIAEEHSDGTKYVRFQPVEAWETAESMISLCDCFDKTYNQSKIDPLLLIPMFILDFLCIHPFNDGNGRMSRLLTLLLLYRSGYIVGKYISIERLIEKSKETYYEVLEHSSNDWHENKNNYLPFVKYMLGIIIAAYREFEERVEVLVLKGYSKPERIAEIIKSTLGKITKSEIAEKCPDISEVTISRALNDLVKKGKITKLGGGRYTTYVWNWE